MEIQVEERLTGRQLRDRILARYGSREALENVARRKGENEAKDDLFHLRLFDEKPSRLLDRMAITTVSTLEPDDLGRLTPERLRLVNFIARQKRPVNLSQIVQGLRRDKKNVSEDLRVLEKLGILSLSKAGRDLRPQLLGNEIHIVVADAG